MKNSNETIKQRYRNITFEALESDIPFFLGNFKVISKLIKDTTLLQFDFVGELPNEPILQNLLLNQVNSIVSRQLFPKLLLFNRPFIITSERTGISLFQAEFAINRSLFYEEMALQKAENKTNRFDRARFIGEAARYSLPINDNISYVRDAEYYSKQQGELWKAEDLKEGVKKLWNSIVQGEFKFVNGTYYYHPENENISIPLHHSSSSIKSLFSLDIYLKHFAAPGDILFIDEPELNLHPRYQIGMARLLARLVNSGISVLITTHSDYIINELSNLILLSGLEKDDQSFLLERYKYDKDELLIPEKVKCYQMSDNTICKCPIDDKGILLQEIDETIGSLNQRYLDIYSFTESDVEDY